ncbi:MAG: hypothetical protein Q8O98_00560 [bacterium]|nr:hypothetical protein [bacterium]
MKKFEINLLVIFAALVLAVPSLAVADHGWGNYHWGRTANPFTLELGNNVSSSWQSYLSVASSDWSVSSVLGTVVKAGKTNPKSCKATTGRVEVCSSKYGFNGWLGIAQIWVSGDHIAKGVVKVNDSYFNTSTYNTPAWRSMVMCQEIGHTFGLDHQDENFSNANLGTCMDYTSNPETNQHPNSHDFDQLEAIYAHLDSVNTVLSSDADTGGGSNGNGKGQKNPLNPLALFGFEPDLDSPSNWGQAVRQDARGNNSIYKRDLATGEKVFTFVIWAD